MKKISILLLSIPLVFLVACSSSVQTNAPKALDGKISIADFKAKMAEIPNAQLVDVRTPEEFNNGTLDGAINMNFRSADLEKQLNTLDKNQPIFIFCQSGGRSGKCYKKMKDMGFSKVYDMEGGYGAWSKQ